MPHRGSNDGPRGNDAASGGTRRRLAGRLLFSPRPNAGVTSHNGEKDYFDERTQFAVDFALEPGG